jgi:3-methylcrotonyl-CoA carboxylase beta subunit
MIRLTSQIDAKSHEFAANRQAMASIVEDLRSKVGAAAGGGSTKAVEKHRARGRLLARERIDLLLDAGAPFLEDRKSVV